MPFSLIDQANQQILRLEGQVTIHEAKVFAEQLSGFLQPAKPLIVETQHLQEIDTCMLQVLCSLQMTTAGFSLKNPSELFVKAVDRRGLRRELMGSRGGE